MARLESVANAHYFPTSNVISRRLGSEINIQARNTIRILDGCAGTGEAVANFAQAIRTRSEIRVFAVELDEGRAMECDSDKRIFKTLHGDFFDLVAVPESFDIMFMNPPYHHGMGERQEVTWLRRITQLLRPEGLLFYIVPGSIFSNSAFLDLLRSYKKNLQVFKFPEDETEYDQHVIVATKMAKGYMGRSWDTPWDPRQLKILPEIPRYFYPVLNEYYRPSMFSFKLEEERIAPPSFEKGDGVYGTTKWRALTANPELRFTSPLVQPRQGHQALLLAAGAINGERLGDTIVKGHAFKTGSEKVEEENTAEGVKTKNTIREILNTQISTLNVKSGEFESWMIQDDPDRARAWFEENSDVLIESVRNRFVPQFDGDCSPWESQLSQLSAPGILPGHSAAEILPIQKEAACANAFYWKHHKASMLSGEMGVGKTLISIASHVISGHEKVVVICPGHLVRKWTSEVDRALGSKRSMIAKSFADIDDFFINPKMRFLVISKEKAKLGTRWRPVYLHRKVGSFQGKLYHNEHIACPACYARVDREQHIELLEEKRQQFCKECEEPLFEYTNLNAKGTKRWPLASYLAHRYPRRFHLIVDECHQYSSTTTSQSRAITRLASACLKALFMTGTLYGGRASSVFQLLHRIDPTFRVVYAHNAVDQFSADFGFFEEVVTTTESHVYGRSLKETRKVKEIPGMNPAMVPIILPYTNFVKLRDLELDLPPYTEHVHRISMDPEVARAYGPFIDEIRSAIRKHPKVLGQYLQAALGWPDRPDQDEEIISYPELGPPETVASISGIEPETYPKDDLAVQICLDEIKSGGKCAIFMTQTHRRDARSRVAAALMEQGIRADILDVNVAPDKRISWIDQRLKDGMQVLITNGRLVETGMDLIFASAIVQYGTEYSIHTLRQSVRRSWRLGQSRPVNVHYVAYEDSVQGAALDLISQKMRAAEAIDGDDIGGLGETARSDSDFFMELAKAAIRLRFDKR